MSYPVTDVIQLAPTTTAAGSYAASLTKLSGDWANDDWIFLAIACSNATGGVTLSTATSGWSEIVELDVASGVRMAVYKAKVASGTVADPTVSLSSGTGLWSAFAWIERDADATDPCPANHYGTADSGVASSFSSATLTPGAGSPVDNCRIVYFAATRNSSDVYLRMLDTSVVGDSLLNISDGTISMAAMIGSTSQTTAAATAKTIYASASPRTGCITLAIKPGTGAKRAAQATLGIERLAWLGSFGATHDATLTPATSSWGAPTNPRTISGVAVSGTAATRTTAAIGQNEWGSYDNHSTTLATAGWQGNMLTYTADVDMSGKMFAVEWNSSGFFSQVGDKGLIVVFEDNGGTNWEAFQLSQKTGFLVGRLYSVIIDLENATPFDSAGTLSWSAVRKVSFLLHRSGSAATARSFGLKNMLLLSKTTLMGGNDGKPLDINYLRRALHGMGYTGLVGGESPAVTLRSDVQIGDGGTTATYYDATGTLHAFPEAYDALTQREINIPANQLDLTIKAGASDTINMTATAVSATLEQNFTIDAASSTSAAYSLVGSSFIGVRWNNAIAINYSGATYSDCTLVELGGSTITGATVTNPASSAAATESLNNVTLSGCEIDVTGTSAAYHLELGTSVTAITLADVTFTGTPATDKIHVLKTTGTVTITISGTTSLVAGDVTSAGATVVISAPVLYQSVVVTGFTAGSRLQIYDVDYNFTVTGVSVYPAAGQTYEDLYGRVYTVISSGAGAVHAYGVTSPKLTGTLTLTKTSGGTGDATITYTACSDDGTELFNGTASAGNTVISGSTATWTDNIAASATRYIRLRRSYVTASTASQFFEQIIGTCGITEGTETVTYLDSPTTDESYETNGIDGSTVTTVTFTDAATDLVNFNVPGGSITWQSIYAAFVYYFFTATGIADDIAYAESPDPANYLFTNTKGKNISSGPVVPLTITGGYGRDAITGLSADIIDTSGGSIFLAPDHVVAYATGSGALTGGDITNIWAAATRTLTTTIPTAAQISTQVLTDAQSTPIHADAKKMNGATIAGTGISSDLWRGA